MRLFGRTSVWGARARSAEPECGAARRQLRRGGEAVRASPQGRADLGLSRGRGIDSWHTGEEIHQSEATKLTTNKRWAEEGIGFGSPWEEIGGWGAWVLPYDCLYSVRETNSLHAAKWLTREWNTEWDFARGKDLFPHNEVLNRIEECIVTGLQWVHLRPQGHSEKGSFLEFKTFAEDVFKKVFWDWETWAHKIHKILGVMFETRISTDLPAKASVDTVLYRWDFYS